MSSLRNAIKRITHKERSQPRARAHLGLLEKKSDFQKRAQNYHRKTKQLQHLREKARNRNPDEFYFGMQKSQVLANGKHVKTVEARNKELEDVIGGEAVRIMKDQDLSYIRMQIQKDQSQVKKLESRLHLLGDEDTTSTSNDVANHIRNENNVKENNAKNIKRKHTIFVKDREQVKNFDVATHFDTVPELAERSFNRPKLSKLLETAKLEQEKFQAQITKQQEKLEKNPNQLPLSPNEFIEKQTEKMEKQSRTMAKQIARARTAAYLELEARKKRQERLEIAESHLITGKLVHSKGHKRKIKEAEDGKPAVYKWRRKRAK